MQLARVLLLPVLLLVGSVPSGALQEEVPTPLRPLVLQVGAVQEGRANEVSRALASMAQYANVQHGQVVRTSVYQTLFYESAVTVCLFSEYVPGSRMEDLFTAFSSDPEWQRRAAEYFASLDSDLMNEILLPVAGRASEPGKARTWRRARAAYGHHAAALRAGRELTEHVNAAHPGTSMRFYVQEMEGLGALHWITDYPELEAWAEVRRSLFEDEAYQALLDELAVHLVEGSVQTQMLDPIRL